LIDGADKNGYSGFRESEHPEIRMPHAESRHQPPECRLAEISGSVWPKKRYMKRRLKRDVKRVASR
jgi:hypothetical protein